ncbi:MULTISPECIES: (2Fe-2S)-binding protein [Olivibacter]|jgi:nicotinate dehydrogenase subunit A|uniref:(2Fe-2S)-binding domain-containing protein n=2 Tax=Sphingobacteriaceae TaxID=84566 RepID=F4CDM2_SPHS2|nr:MULTISPECIES: (2Fe-2S)-binding protein [Olivibacter]MDM8177336.1 (2Fe-2S)-binding protein [Olivibacter sp. 47]QEK99785.1 (2Fe-2S)-binding protein [Olivibacter sp. LS-1]
MDTINLKVNGKNYSLRVGPETPLLYVLRNNLQLNGPKYGCGVERCGSCMVLIDGIAMPSCKRPCHSLADSSITTLEGISQGEQLDTIQEAFIKEQAAQCGYCLNGMIIASKALLQKNSNPTDEEIRIALQRVLCRCGSHNRIMRAIRRASLTVKASL